MKTVLKKIAGMFNIPDKEPQTLYQCHCLLDGLYPCNLWVFQWRQPISLIIRDNGVVRLLWRIYLHKSLGSLSSG